MKLNNPQNPMPLDGEARKAVKPVICYPTHNLPVPDLKLYQQARETLVMVDEVRVEPREAACFKVKAGQFFRVICVDGAQVGDLNLWNADNLNERFFSCKTRALHGTHLSTGDQMWSSFPYLRPMATISYDSLDWYGWDEFGGSVHDVIGTRCGPYTHNLLSGGQYNHCCHSNLTRSLAHEKNMKIDDAEAYIHDVLNVFMCTGFTADSHQYFMKASPVRPGDYLEFFAEIDLLGCLSACPGGDCGDEHSSDQNPCYPMIVEVYETSSKILAKWKPAEPNEYNRTHGL